MGEPPRPPFGTRLPLALGRHMVDTHALLLLDVSYLGSSAIGR